VTNKLNKAGYVPFNGKDSRSLADEIMATLKAAAKSEVAAARAEGFNTPGVRDGKIVLRTPKGKLISPQVAYN
jgi:hypothetical protein